MLIDTRIIHRHAGHEVLAERQTIRWPDGSTVCLHPVRAHGYTDMFLRAMQADATRWFIFDLRDISPSCFEADVKALPARDLDGMALYTLRLGYENGRRCTNAALGHMRCAWRATATEGVPA